jgi:multiple sugar transport system permease protein
MEHRHHAASCAGGKLRVTRVLKKGVLRAAFVLLLVLVTLVVLFPFLWMLASSFKSQVDIIAWPPRIFFAPTVQNYERVFGEQDFLKYFFNSTLIGTTAVSAALLLGLPAAYSIARFRQRRLSVFILVARLMPGISFLMPWYIIFSRIGLMDTYIALILSHLLIVLPLVVWIMASYFASVPEEMEESGMVDGATRQRAFLSLILPLSGPGVVTATTLSFIFSWNNFMFSQVLSMEKTKTLPIAVYNFVSYAEVDWGAVMAAAVAIIAPAIVLTMIFQKYVVKGLTMGAVKG